MQPTVLSSVSLQECSDWLHAFPEDHIAQSQPLKRVHSAITLLQMQPTCAQRQRIQKILKDWDVPQKHKSKKRNSGDAKANLLSSLCMSGLHNLKRSINGAVVITILVLDNLSNSTTVLECTVSVSCYKAYHTAVLHGLL